MPAENLFDLADIHRPGAEAPLGASLWCLTGDRGVEEHIMTADY